MIEKHRVHGLAHRLIATERERQVGHPARNMSMRQVGSDPAGGIDEIIAIVVVLFNARGHGKNIGIKDNVFRREADFLGKQFVRAFANLDLALKSVSLAFFIKRHDHHSRPIAAHFARLL